MFSSSEVTIVLSRAIHFAKEAVAAREDKFEDPARVFAGLARAEIASVRSHCKTYRDTEKETIWCTEAEYEVSRLLEKVGLHRSLQTFTPTEEDR